MKKFLNLSLSLLMFSLFLNSCSQTESFNNDSNCSIELISPQGFVIANNLFELKDKIGINYEDKIDSIAYIDIETFTSAFIYYTKENGTCGNTALVSGRYEFKSSNVATSSQLKSSGSLKVSCDDCSDCKVEGTIEGTSVTYKCSRSCCSLTIEPVSRATVN